MYKYITHDARECEKSNLRVSTASNHSDVIELISYDTTVAYGYVNAEVYNSYILGHMSYDQILENCDWHYTDRKYSRTTSKQVTRFLNAVCGGRENATEKPHKDFREALDTGIYI